MKSQVLKDYLLYLLPAVVIPFAFSLSDASVPLANLFKVGLLFPILMLAMKGLMGFFPAENLRERSLARMVEHAILQGLVFAAFVVLASGLVEPALQPDLLSVVRQFALSALLMSVFNLAMALRAQKKLRAS